jgi:hypothetical protein
LQYFEFFRVKIFPEPLNIITEGVKYRKLLWVAYAVQRRI